MILSYDAYTETLEKQKEKEDRLELVEKRIAMLMNSQKEIQEILKSPDKLATIIHTELSK